MNKPLPKVEFIPAALQETLSWLLSIEDFDLTKRLIERISLYAPKDQPEMLDYKAMVLHHAKQYPEALEVAKHTYKLLPHNHNAAYNLARCYNACGMPDEAEKYMKQVLTAMPKWASARIDAAVYVCAQGRFDEAHEMLLQALKDLPPGDSEQEIIQFNLGWHLIRKGDFKKGMDYLRIGRKLRIWGAYSSNITKPVLKKHDNVNGKRVLIVGEGGAGDEMINARFAQVLRQRGAIPMMASLHKLEGLFSRVPDMHKAIPHKEVSQTDFDYWAPAMDMPQILDVDLHEIPNQKYLSASPEYANKWKQIIPPNKKFKLGLRWQGNPLYERDLYRSVPFKEFEAFFDIPNVEFYSLQRDSGVEELDPTSPVKDLSGQLQTWEDTAAAINELDMVITSCTSIAHLAAGLGKKTWVYTPINHYYIWASPGDKSAWYPDVMLYKQTRFRHWSDITQRINQDLRQLISQTFTTDGACRD